MIKEVSGAQQEQLSTQDSELLQVKKDKINIIERIIFVQVCLRNLQFWLLILLRVREKSLLNDIKQL